jgi:hypothetical protein
MNQSSQEFVLGTDVLNFLKMKFNGENKNSERNKNTEMSRNAI